MGRPKKIKVDEVVQEENIAVVEQVEVNIPDGWEQLTEEEMDEAQRNGLLVGWDPSLKIGLLNKGEQNA